MRLILLVPLSLLVVLAGADAPHPGRRPTPPPGEARVRAQHPPPARPPPPAPPPGGGGGGGRARRRRAPRGARPRVRGGALAALAGRRPALRGAAGERRAAAGRGRALLHVGPGARRGAQPPLPALRHGPA